MGVRKGHVGGGEHVLDEDALVALKGSIDEGHGSGKTICDEIALTVGPIELEIVHGGTTGRGVRRVVGGGRWPWMRNGDRGGGEGAEGLRLCGVEGRDDLLGNVENGGDATVAEGGPVAGIVFRAKPDTREDLDGAGGIGDGGRAVLVLSVDCRR